MKPEEKEKSIQKIIIGLDASPHSLAALELAALLAEKYEAELIGIYVEDINLIRIAALPFVREVDFFSTMVRQVDTSQVVRHLHAQARRAQRALAAIGTEARLRWSFRVSRGVISAELLAAALEADLVILGKVGWSRRRQLGSTAQVVVAQSPRQTLIFQPGEHLKRPILVVYDGSEAGDKALITTGQLRVEDSPVTVVIIAKNPELATQLKAKVVTWSKENDIDTHVLRLSKLDGSMIARLAWSERCGVLVLPAESKVIPIEAILTLLNKAHCAVMLVR